MHLIEGIWSDNVATIEGMHLHRQADLPGLPESRDGLLVARSLPLRSLELGLVGRADVVEFRRLCDSVGDGCALSSRRGRWRPFPVEYKRGREKQDPCDEAQLCAQAICLEEMLLVDIPRGYLYYGRTRRRVAVELTTELRELVRRAAKEMHTYFRRGHTPRVKPSKACRSCSLADICLPELGEKVIPASEYIRQQIDGI